MRCGQNLKFENVLYDGRTVKHFDRIRRQMAQGEPLDASFDDPAMEDSGDESRMLDTFDSMDWVKDITHRFNHEESDLAPSQVRETPRWPRSWANCRKASYASATGTW